MAVNLLYASLAIGVLRGAFAGFRLAETKSVNIAWVLFLAASYFSWLIIFKIKEGKNWARITCLVLFIAKLPFFKPTLLSSFSTQPTATTIAIAQMVMQIAALFLLYQSESTEWYKQMKLSAQPRP